jgi:hypothetical protein
MNTNANPRRRLLAIMLGAALMTALGFRAREWGPLPGRLVSLHDSRRNYAYSEAARLPDLKRQPLTAPLIQSSADPNPKIRRYAIYALRKFALKDETVVRALLSSMNDQDPTVRPGGRHPEQIAAGRAEVARLLIPGGQLGGAAADVEELGPLEHVIRGEVPEVTGGGLPAVEALLDLRFSEDVPGPLGGGDLSQPGGREAAHGVVELDQVHGRHGGPEAREVGRRG